MTTKVCQQVGYTAGPQYWEQRTNVDGRRYWHVREAIGSLGGFSVNGEIEAFGRTKEEASERLLVERKKLLDVFFEA